MSFHNYLFKKKKNKTKNDRITNVPMILFDPHRHLFVVKLTKITN